MQHRITPLMVVGVLGLISVAVIAIMYSDLLGARLISKGGRVNVAQGEKVTLALSSSKQARKLEICTEKKNLVSGRSEYINCKPLASTVKANQTKVEVVIPASFPLGRAVVITRIRAANGTLLPTVATDEKIALLVTKAKPQPVIQTESDGGGGSSDGGGGSSDGDSNSRSSSTVTSVNYELLNLCYEGADDSIHLRWKPVGAILKYRKVGESTWRQPAEEYNYSNPYDDESDARRTIIYVSQNDLPPNTDFEFYLWPGNGAPTGLPAQSQIYHYNTGPLPAYSECRSLL